MADRSAPAALHSECSRPSAPARLDPDAFPGLVVNNSMPPPAPPARPFVTPTPTPFPATVASPGQGPPDPPPRPSGALLLSQTPLQKEVGEGPCVRPRSSVPTSSLSSSPPPTLPLRCAPPAVPTPHTTTALPRAAAVSAARPALTHKEKAKELNKGKKEKSDTLQAARRASAPVLPPLNPSGPRSTEGRTGALCKRELEPERY